MKTTPRKHQADIHESSKEREYYGILLEQGLGKTKIVIDTAFWLYAKDEIETVLVIAPNGVHLNWYYEELPKHGWNPCDMAIWRSNARKNERMMLSDIVKKSKRLRWLFMNIEAIRTKRGFEMAKKFIGSGDTLLVMDESTVIKNPKAKQTVAAMALSRLSKYKRILTGTPITQGPLDLFSQCQFLDPKAIPFTSYTAFKRTFAVEQIMVMGNRSFTKVVGYRNLEYLSEIIKPFTIRLKKEDCIDLPEKVFTTQFVELTREQESLYQSIKETQVAMLEQEQQVTGMVSVTSVLAALVKLQQVCCGFVIDDDGKIHNVRNNRINALETLTEDSSEKYVIWTTFRHCVESLQRYFADKYGPASVVSYYGGTHHKDRPEAVRDFNGDSQVRFFIANRAASKGLTLTAASRAIYYSNSFSLEDRLQSEDRIHRIGQSKTCFYTDLVCKGTIEEKVVSILMAKKELADKVIKSDWKEIFE